MSNNKYHLNSYNFYKLCRSQNYGMSVKMQQKLVLLLFVFISFNVSNNSIYLSLHRLSVRQMKRNKIIKQGSSV